MINTRTFKSNRKAFSRIELFMLDYGICLGTFLAIFILVNMVVK